MANLQLNSPDDCLEVLVGFLRGGVHRLRKEARRFLDMAIPASIWAYMESLTAAQPSPTHLASMLPYLTAWPQVAVELLLEVVSQLYEDDGLEHAACLLPCPQHNNTPGNSAAAADKSRGPLPCGSPVQLMN
jgi:hypothetical protein